MAEEPLVIRGINWRETFPFTHIFRAFRIAIHPSKLVLALLAMLCLYFGGRILDALWLDQYKAVPGEIFYYDDPGVGTRRLNAQPGDFKEWVKAQREAAAQEYAGLLQQVDKPEFKEFKESTDKALAAARQGKYTRDVRYWIGTTRDKKVQDLHKSHDELVANNNKLPQNNDAEKEVVRKANEAADKNEADGIREAYQGAARRYAVVKTVAGQGLFEAFLHYQTTQVAKVAQGVLANNWLGQMYQANDLREPGVIISVFKFFTVAPSWALHHHTLYFFLYGALFLCVWSLFGGAIARIAAVHVADEGRKLSVRQGLSFAFSKFLSFISAPMIPMIIVAGIGLVLAAAGGVLMLIPGAGPVVVGALFFLPLAAGFVMTLVLLGTAGGGNLMYPTIAVEGSDSFDAISRSFSYVYAKPWRMLWYSVVALAYGSACFLFVRLFLWLMLCLTQYFVGWFALRHTPTGDYVWSTMFPRPGFWSFSYDPDTQALGPGEKFGSWLIAIWVYLAISMLGAFAISFYFSASTIIYYLMRREVDATEMDDVYLDQPEEDFAESGPASAAASAEVSAASVPQEPPAPPGTQTAPSTGGAATYDAPAGNPATPPPGETPPKE